MSKNNMKLKYKPQKRERNKNKIEENTTPEIKSVIKTVVIVVVSIAVLYGITILMEKAGLFEEGYTKPETEDETISYEFISIGTVFNRDVDEYYVLFDNFESSYTNAAYVESLLDNQDTRVFKVDMSKSEYKKYISSEGNSDAQSVSELKINGVTLIKISNGENVKYIEGVDNIEEYLE